MLFILYTIYYLSTLHSIEQEFLIYFHRSKYEEQETLIQQLQHDKTNISNKLQHVDNDLFDHKQVSVYLLSPPLI